MVFKTSLGTGVLLHSRIDILWLSKYSKLLVPVSGVDIRTNANKTKLNTATIAGVIFFASRFVADKCNPI
jgi:hypothetical protein